MRILALNAGSATLKATVLAWPDRTPAFDRAAPWDGDADTQVERLAAVLRASTGAIEAVGHRVVHGGTRFVGPTVLDDAAVAAIDNLADLAPLHNPIAAETIRAARRLLPGIPQVACFDTAFHASLPEASVRYPVPDAWHAAGIRRYGFHGLSVAWSTQRAAELLERPATELRLVVAHLGGGCSVTAVDGGRSLETSMGMTPLEGLMMGTRAGSIDPGVILRLWRSGRSVDEVETDLERGSGLFGIAGSADMRELLARERDGDARAALALEMFVNRAAAGIASAATALDALDAIVFTGGIGEHADGVTSRVVERLHAVAGSVRTQEQSGDRVSRFASGPAILRVAAREDLTIAGEVVAALPGAS